MELTIVSMLMVFLAMLLASAWVTVCKSMVGMTARTEIAQEMDFAVAALSRDLGGSLYLSGSSTTATFTGWEANSGNSQLELDFAGYTVTYFVDSYVLVRRDLNNTTLAYTDFNVAKDVNALTVTPSSDGSTMTIQLDFGCYRGTDTTRSNPLVKRTCVLTAAKPSS